MHKTFPFLLLLLTCAQCVSSQEQQKSRTVSQKEQDSPIDSLYQLYQNQLGESKSIGTVNNGRLENGRILPYRGANFFYFDSISYMNKRAFVHANVLETVLSSYRTLMTILPKAEFGIMECSNEKGGKIYPHRTHQNGLSIDFMTPMLKNGRSTSDLDHLGAEHYFLAFDNTGHYSSDTSYSIDFERMAQHLLVLNAAAKLNHLKISKVLLKIELKDELFATSSGKKLKASGMYFAQNLSPLINSLHDDHYHVDFEICP